MKRLLTLLTLVLLLAGCSDSRDPVIRGYRIHQVGGMTFGIDGISADVQLDLDIDNPSGARYTVEALQAAVFPANDTVRYADIYLKEKAIIPSKSSGTVAIPLDVRLRRPLSLLSGGLSGELSRYEADVDMTIRRGSIKKRIQKERVPLEKIAELLGSGMKKENKDNL